MSRNIIFRLDFRYFKDISDKVIADDKVTCMMTSSLLYCVDFVIFCNLDVVSLTKFYNTAVGYYFHYIIQQLTKMNIFYVNAVYFEKQQKKQ